MTSNEQDLIVANIPSFVEVLPVHKTMDDWTTAVRDTTNLLAKDAEKVEGSIISKLCMLSAEFVLRRVKDFDSNLPAFVVATGTEDKYIPLTEKLDLDWKGTRNKLVSAMGEDAKENSTITQMLPNAIKASFLVARGTRTEFTMAKFKANARMGDKPLDDQTTDKGIWRVCAPYNVIKPNMENTNEDKKENPTVPNMLSFLTPVPINRIKAQFDLHFEGKSLNEYGLVASQPRAPQTPNDEEDDTETVIIDFAEGVNPETVIEAFHKMSPLIASGQTVLDDEHICDVIDSAIGVINNSKLTTGTSDDVKLGLVKLLDAVNEGIPKVGDEVPHILVQSQDFISGIKSWDKQPPEMVQMLSDLYEVCVKALGIETIEAEAEPQRQIA